MSYIPRLIERENRYAHTDTPGFDAMGNVKAIQTVLLPSLNRPGPSAFEGLIGGYACMRRAYGLY